VQQTLPKVAQWVYKNPGVWSVSQVAGLTGVSRQSVGVALRAMSELEPKLVQRMQTGVYLVRPAPGFAPEEEAEREEVFAAFDVAERDGRLGRTAPPEREPAFSRDFVEILPDDDDLYPPFKIKIYDHFRGKRGEQWFRTKDETGKRGIFRWVDDD
jgi:hypothetical protein